MTTDVTALRQRGVAMVAIGGWMLVIALILMALSGNGDAAAAAALIGAIVNLVPTYCAYKERTDGSARIAIGVLAALQPYLLYYAMHDTPWQDDMHLFFFVTMASLTLLWDMRPIIIACLLILAHDVIHPFFDEGGYVVHADGWVQPLIHASATIIVGIALCWVTLSLAQTMAKVTAARELSERQAEELQRTSDSLEQALCTVEAEQKASAQAREEAEQLRQEDNERIAKRFESSVSAVTQAVADTAIMLERSAKGLRAIAVEVGSEARDVAISAESASKATSMVAAGVAEMSHSIASIAVNAGQQSELTAEATDRSGTGGEAIAQLSGQSRTIGKTTQAIVRVAERTDLLSLNAAIEAASAGVAGRGFTVVAQEVKGLATQASDAAVEIDRFLSGVRSGTLEAERSFEAIDAAIIELNKAASSIRADVENQRASADTIENVAREAAGEADSLVERTKALSERADATRSLSDELQDAATALSENVRNLELSTESFIRNLKVA